MNHLAHAHLSGTSQATLVGNLAADYLRPKEAALLPPPLRTGVRVHRFIDDFTDRDPSVREAWALLRPQHGKYASVIYDIYCDYLLTTGWARHAHRPLPEVTSAAYAALREHGGHLPESLSARFERMIASDWLRQYGTYEGQAYVFERFGRRLSKPELLDGVIDTLRTHEGALAGVFREFYPWLKAAVRARGKASDVA